MKNVIDLFLQLVKIDSPSGEEKEMAKFIKKWLNNYKFNYQADGQGNIFAKNNKKGKPILFCVHLDTVNPGKGIIPVIKNNQIKSSGATILGADNKAAIASLLTALNITSKSKNNNRPIELLFTVKEETGGGVELFPFKWVRSKEAFVFDAASPLGGIIMSSPYIINFDVKYIGKARHASSLQAGKNTLIPLFNAMKKIPLGMVDKETTCNIGLIKGGTGINIVPQEVDVQGEVRSYSKKSFVFWLSRIEEIFRKEAKKEKVKFSIKKTGFCSGYLHSKGMEIIKKLKRIINQVGLKPKFYYKSAVSDANILNAKGITTLNLTDGVIKPHTVEEAVLVKDLITLTKLIIQIIKSY